MSNEFVMVPREQLSKIREWIESARDWVLYPIARDFEGVVGRNAEGLGQETPAILDGIDELLVKQAMHLGEPVLYYKPLIGAEAKPTGECYSVFFTPMPGHQPLFASAEPSAPKCKSCGQVPEGQSGEYPCKACGLPTVHDEPSAPKCTYCGDTGQIMVGRSGDANDGNAPIMEPCEDCDGPSAPVEIDEREQHHEN